ncbi:hypothetical protein KC717_06135 [Candidatus Dojkabacteria bacterium]|uniref:Uncharacterized protein n=1 Tax=Candidatus Dojkabacteria bacterium TaxID=2099670 RepID=A0A955L9N0_9BACT|nr:hypothetical protein [Candidatus Dojkabacteria bacterium]
MKYSKEIKLFLRSLFITFVFGIVLSKPLGSIAHYLLPEGYDRLGNWGGMDSVYEMAIFLPIATVNSLLLFLSTKYLQYSLRYKSENYKVRIFFELLLPLLFVVFHPITLILAYSWIFSFHVYFFELGYKFHLFYPAPIIIHIILFVWQEVTIATKNHK